jgi:hypothetical protein
VVFNLFVGMTEWLRKKAVESTRLFYFLPWISQNDRTTAAKQIVCSLKGHKSLSRDNYFIGNDIECPFIRHEKPKWEKS